MYSFAVFLFGFLVISSDGYKFFQDRVPNGDNIPNPCNRNLRWPGLGHQNSQGGGIRNPFGLDFYNNQKKWDATLCQKDSDGDGKTNGEELGDPQCTWKEGEIPEITSGLSHPGICEPLEDPACKGKNQWDICANLEFDCKHIHDPEADIRNITLHMNQTKVPAKHTTYMCASFELPHDQEYHVVATKPIIDNGNIMHHMIFYGCGETEDTLFETPKECGMLVSQEGRCQTGLGGWTLGSNGDCMHKDAGFRMGNNGTKRVIIEYHWNNPEERGDYVDSSGVIIYYTPKLRKYDAGGLILGEMALRIEPKTELTSYTAACTSKCTQNYLPHSIYVFKSYVHMHYLGHSGKIEHIRGNTRRDLANDEIYSYDSPVYHRYDDSEDGVVEIKPGDELHLTCNFNSKYREHVTYYGEGTSDEMCFGFLTYFPKQKNLQICTEFNELDLCESRLPENGGYHTNFWRLKGCDMGELLNSKSAHLRKLYGDIVEECSNYKDGCSVSCKEAISRAKQHPCYQGDVGLLNQFLLARREPKYGRHFLNVMRKCDYTQLPGHPANAAVPLFISFYASVLLLFSIIL